MGIPIIFKLSNFSSFNFTFSKSMKLPYEHSRQLKSSRQEYYPLGYKPLYVTDLETGERENILHFDERYNFVQIASSVVIIGEKVINNIPSQKYNDVIRYLKNRYVDYKKTNPEFKEKLNTGGRKFTGYIYLHEFIEYVIHEERREKILKIKDTIRKKRLMKNTQL